MLEAVEGERSQQEIAWAVRSWTEQLAAAQPLVLVFEDIHWARGAAARADRAPRRLGADGAVLLLCLARPELLDVRPAWGGGRLRAVTLELEALPYEEGVTLVERSPPKWTCRSTSRRAREDRGEPALRRGDDPHAVDERGDGLHERIPDTLQALIAARIDRLPPRSSGARSNAPR